MKLAFNHLPFNKLADLAEGLLPPNERSPALEHIGFCSHCAAKLSRLEQIINLMRTDKAEAVPPEVVSRAVNLFRSRKRTVSSEPSPVRRLLAALSFDSLQTSAAYGIRSGQAVVRQLLYVAQGDYDIDMRIASAGETWLISGQVFGPGCMGGHVEIKGNSQKEQADLSDECEFKLAPVPSGIYHLRLRLADAEIEVPELKLGA